MFLVKPIPQQYWTSQFYGPKCVSLFPTKPWFAGGCLKLGASDYTQIIWWGKGEPRDV